MSVRRCDCGALTYSYGEYPSPPSASSHPDGRPLEPHEDRTVCLAGPRKGQPHR